MISSTIRALGATLVLFGAALPALGQGADNYVRFEFGGAFDATGDALWQPPGYPKDPEVHFDLSADNGVFASAAIGRAFTSQFRGDISLSFFGETDFSGPWSYTVPTVAGPHSDITGGSVSTTALMANGYWSPFGASGSSQLTPFVTAGLGVAQNRMGDWTRTNTASNNPVRTFEGENNTDLAWSIGFGVSANLGEANGTPILFEATYRYFDLGTAMGSGTPLAGNGTSNPVKPLEFENRDHVISIGIRIPIGG